MMTDGNFTEGDKAIIKSIAWEVGDAITKQMNASIEAQMKSRCDACLIAKKVDRAAMALKTTWVFLGGTIALIAYLTNMFMTYFKK